MRGKLFLLTFLGALLLVAGWPYWGFSPLLFIAFVPLLLVQRIVNNDNRLRARHLFFYAYLVFLLWNLFTTWWIWYASAGGACLAIICNSLLMAIVFLVYHKIKRALPERYGSFILIPLWIAYEYLHHDWDLTWPWLTLGNGMASDYKWIQWYEYTGVFGGSLWILLVNILLFELIIRRKTLPIRQRIIRGSGIVLLFILPVTISYLIYHSLENRPLSVPIKVVVVQPNIDPYKKFNGQHAEQLEKMLALAQQKVDTSTDYLVFPETAISQSIWESELYSCWSITRLKEFLGHYPKLKIITGATTAHEYRPGEELSATVREFKSGEPGYYDIFNTALQVDTGKFIQQYHKSKLVPGVEKMPFPKYLHFLEGLAIDMGGSVGSLGVQSERTVLRSENSQVKIAPAICYESIYSEFISEYVKNGADYIFIITNDGWWDDTPGHIQHLLYGRLRAIETRKAIARSANTGISCFVNTKGDILQPQKWWTAASISAELRSEPGMTFYTRHGDYIARAMLWITMTALLYSIVRFILKKFVLRHPEQK